KMICGNMGGTQRLEYTAIGDNVNLASRLEGTNKFFDTKIMVGENSFNMLPVGDIFRKRLHYIGKFSVKGKDIPIRFYSYDNKSPKVHELFDKMLAAFEDNDAGTFKKAVKYFTDNKIEYGPALFYIKHYEDTKKIGEFIKLHEK
ncbi:MAG: adenylate/guanylate cyclase domain-containing protein, partial [Spirochaetales bacterium]|nr:adenylate/guanylate cyclase domain-containing protein [Spirochaetales bacterium]